MARYKLTFTTTIAPDRQSSGGMIVVLERNVSASLPTRDQCDAELLIDNQLFNTAVLPTRDDTHYFIVDEAMQQALGKGVGDTVAVEIAHIHAAPIE